MRIEDAVDFFTDRIHQNDKDDEAWASRAWAWKERGELDIAVKDYNEAVRLNPKSAAWLVDRGLVWWAKKDLDKALDDFNGALRIDPQNALAWNNRGSVHYARQDYDKAIADFDETVKLDPKYVSAFVSRGNAHYSKAEYDKAIDDYGEAVRLDPHDAMAFDNRGNAWTAAGTRTRRSPTTTRRCGWTRLTSPRTSTGGPRGRKRATWRRRSPTLRMRFGSIPRTSPRSATGRPPGAKQDYDKAIADCDEAIRLDPNDAPTFRDRALAWSAKREYAKALADYQEAVRLNPDSADGLNGMAWLLATSPDEKLRDGKKAVEAARHACELGTWKEPRHIDTLAAAYAEAGDFDEAVKWEKKALEFPDFEKSAGDRVRMRLQMYEDHNPFRLEK